MSTIEAVRLEFPSFNHSKFQDAISTLQDGIYENVAIQKQAPKITNCVTAIRYALEIAT